MTEQTQDHVVNVPKEKFLKDAQRVQDFLQHVEQHHPAYAMALLKYILDANQDNFKIHRLEIEEPEAKSPILGVRKN